MVRAPNHLAALAWGLRSESTAHRRGAMVSWLGPAGLYLVIVLLIGLALAYNNFIDVRRLSTFEYWVALDAAAWYVGVLFCVILPFRIENKFSSAKLLRANYPDYRLAGFTGHDVLTGMAAPRIAGIKLFAYVYVIVMLIGVSLLTYFQAKAIVLLLLLALSLGASIFSLIVGSYYNLAQWALSPNKAVRYIKTAGIVFTGPVTLCTLYPMFMIFLTIAIFLEVISVAIRSNIAVNAWTRAQKQLDGNDHANPLVPPPDQLDQVLDNYEKYRSEKSAAS